jgi:undecaprenyl-diphosphatase
MSGAVHRLDNTRTREGEHWVRAWPLHKRSWLILVAGSAALFAIWTGVGLLYMHLLDDGPVGDADRRGARWLAEHRTSTLNTLSDYGSMMSETLVKVILIATVGGAMVIVFRRWHDGVFLAMAVIVEASVFVTSAFVVDRDRPPVHHLDPPAPSGSFPSGHTAAAVAFYAGVFMVVLWHTRNRAWRWVFGVIGVAVPLIVGSSRVYRGMHHPIDVVAGLLLGVASLLVVRAALRAGVEEIDRDADESVPTQVRSLDLTHRIAIDRSDDERAHPIPTSGVLT